MDAVNWNENLKSVDKPFYQNLFEWNDFFYNLDYQVIKKVLQWSLNNIYVV